MMEIRRGLRGSRGFTLIEIAIVVAIIGILLLIALPLFTGARVRAYVAEARQLSSEWKSLTWACLIERNFREPRCDTIAEVGWSPPPASDAWNWPGAVMFCGAISPVTATQGASTCATDITIAPAVIGMRVPRTGTIPGLNNDYVIAINTITGTVGESPADGTSFTP